MNNLTNAEICALFSNLQDRVAELEELVLPKPEPEPEPEYPCETDDCDNTLKDGHKFCKQCRKAWGLRKKLQKLRREVIAERGKEFPDIPPKGLSLYD